MGRIADVFLHLGEISLENENFEQAVEDLTACLNKRKDLLPADSRSIAETHYQLGIAQAYSGNFEAGEGSMVAAVGVLSARLLNLKKMEEAFSGASEAGATAEKPVSSIMVKRKSEAGDAAVKDGDTAAAAM